MGNGDWFKITTPTIGGFKLSLTNEEGYESHMELYDANKNMIAKSVDKNEEKVDLYQHLDTDNQYNVKVTKDRNDVLNTYYSIVFKYMHQYSEYMPNPFTESSIDLQNFVGGVHLNEGVIINGQYMIDVYT